MDQEEMILFFPGGFRVMLVDDDTKTVRTATSMMSALHCPVVATYPTANAGLRALSGDNVVDVQAVLCDVHKVVSSGFDFCRVVETELHIPVIYLLSMDDMVADEDAAFLNRLLQTATYIIKKPLDSAVMGQLWRVVAWHQFCLGAGNMDRAAPADDEAAGADGEDNDDNVIIVKELQIHFKAVRAGGSRKRQLTIIVDNDDNHNSSSGSSGGADSNPTKILEHRNVKGLERQHVASHLQPPPPPPPPPQKYRPRQQKKDQLDERPLLPPDSPFLKAILPTLNVPPCNPLVVAGGARPSNVATAAFPGDSGAAAPFQVAVHQQPHLTGNAVINFNNAAPVVVQAQTVGQAPAGNSVIFFNNGAAPAMGQQLSGGVQPDVPQQKLFLGPFSYQGPRPPAMQKHINLLPPYPPRVGMVMDKGKAPLIELPFGQPVDDLLAGETAYGGAGPSVEAPEATAAYAYTGALQNNAAAGSLLAPPMEPMFSITEPIVATQSEAAAAKAAAPNNSEPFLVPDQVDPASPIAAEEDIMFSLESLLGLDDDAMLPPEDSSAAEDAAGDAAGGSLNGEEGDMELGWDLDDILMNNANEFSFLDDLAGSE